MCEARAVAPSLEHIAAGATETAPAEVDPVEVAALVGAATGASAVIAVPEPAGHGPAAAVSYALFRDTIIAAAAAVGFDGEGADGLKGYLRKIATEDQKIFFGVLAKLIAPDTASGAEETVTRIERVIVRAGE
jgi:hypothetical protein